MEDMMEIPIEEWFVFKLEALRYLNKVASEIRMRSSNDPLLQRTADFIAVQHVSYSRIGYTAAFEHAFHFEVDRGRPFKGYRYNVRDNGEGLVLWQMGTDNRVLVPIYFDELEGQHLLDAIREMLVADVLKM
jgi:hypothetical protein